MTRALLFEGDKSLRLSRMTSAASMGATFALLPFERYTGAVTVGPLTVTGLEVVWAAAIVAWLALLATEHRPPALPRPVAGALIVLFAGGLVSAVLAGAQSQEALKFLARSSMGWLLFAAAADLLWTERDAQRTAHRLIVCILGGAVGAAIFGLVGPLLFQGEQLGTVGREFVVGGVRRLQGPFDYPNTAAMAFEASGLCGLGLFSVATGRWQRLLIGAGLVLVTAAMLLTLSRGASLGALAGLGAITFLAAVSHRRRLALMPLAAAVVIAAGTVVTQLSGLPLERLLGTEGDGGFYGATYSAPPVIRASPGAEARVTVELVNTGSATWNVSSAEDYRLAYRWLDPSTGQLVADGIGRAGLGGPVGPGQQVSVAASIEVPVESGVHLLAWDLVHENAAWFSEKGVPVATSQVLVGTQAGGQASVIAPGAVVELFPGLRPVPDRGQLWQAAVAMIGERPMLGEGPGTFRLRYGSHLGWDRWDERVHANNMYLELGATTGMIGLVAFLFLVGFVMSRQLRQVLRRPPSGDPPSGDPPSGDPPSGDPPSGTVVPDTGWMFHAALVGALVAFLVHGLVDYFLGFNPTAGLFWAVLGVGLGIVVPRPGGRVSSSA